MMDINNREIKWKKTQTKKPATHTCLLHTIQTSHTSAYDRGKYFSKTKIMFTTQHLTSRHSYSAYGHIYVHISESCIFMCLREIKADRTGNARGSANYYSFSDHRFSRFITYIHPPSVFCYSARLIVFYSTFGSYSLMFSHFHQSLEFLVVPSPIRPSSASVLFLPFKILPPTRPTRTVNKRPSCMKYVLSISFISMLCFLAYQNKKGPK